MKNLEKYSILLIISILLLTCLVNNLTAQGAGSLTDQDGNTYKTSMIGDQSWMIENLKTTRFNDGTPIELVTDRKDWAALSSPAYCWYNNDTTYKDIYGALYNGYALFTGKLCPDGWHVSTDDDWSILISFLGGESVAGGKLKETGTGHWNIPNSDATNESKFSALPGGSRYTNGLFLTVKNLGYWWSPVKEDSYNSWYRSLYYKDKSISRSYIDSTNGFSVRCVKNL